MPNTSVLLAAGLVCVIVVFVMLVYLHIVRKTIKERDVFPWQNEVEPKSTNLSEKNFDSLRHLLIIDSNNEREDVVYCVCRRHGVVAIQLIPMVILFFITIIGSIYLMIRPPAVLDSVYFIGTSQILLLGTIIVLAIFARSISAWVDWRYQYYMVTNKAVHIIRMLPPLLAFLPGKKQRLPLSSIAKAGSDDSFLGNALGFFMVVLSTYMTEGEDADYNNMMFVPRFTEFDRVVQSLTGRNNNSPR